MFAIPLPAFEYQRMRWKNNLGWTREVFAFPPATPSSGAAPSAAASPGEDFDWRVSIAEIEQDCPFSAFPGHDRLLMLLSGRGLALAFPDGRRVELRPPHDRLAFRGEDAPACTLLDGPTQDFNLIWKRDRVRADLLHRPLVGPMMFFPEQQVQWIVYLVSGQARIKDRPELPALESGDSLLLQPAAGGGGRVVLEGGGEVLAARFESVRA